MRNKHKSSLVLAAVVAALGVAEGQTPINGNWSPWGHLTTKCMDPESKKEVLCGGGVKERYRSCTHPEPQFGGADCVVDPESGHGNVSTMPCNTNPCKLPDRFLWSPWGSCSETCGRGVRTRNTMCGSIRIRALESDTPATTTSTSTTTSTTTTSTSTTTATTTADATAKRRRKRGLNGVYIDVDEALYELEYEEACQGDQFETQTTDCNTWNPAYCGNPCDNVECPIFAQCHNISTAEDPVYECRCELGTIMKDDKSACIVPPPTKPTPRPNPTLPPAQKTAATVVTRTASTVIIICLSVTLGLFFVFRIFDPSRVIHTNMEIALLCAHLCLLPTAYENEDNRELCRVLSILMNMFFIACFMFMLLEALYLYSMVGWVVKKNGLLSGPVNMMVGWGTTIIIILFDMCFQYENFGGEYHCFLQLNTNLVYGIYVPLITLTIVTFAIAEAAGGAAEYEKLEDVDKAQRTSAMVMRSTLVFILPLVFCSYVLGSLAEYEQNIYLYSLFTIFNGIIGVFVFIAHCFANETIRKFLKDAFSKCCGKKDKDDEDD